MLHSENHSEMSVLERQRSRLQWQQEQLIQHQPITFFNENVQLGCAFPGFNPDQGGFGELMMGGAMKPDPGFETGSNGGFRSVLSYGSGPPELETGSYANPRTVSCPQNAAAATNMAQDSSGAAPTEGSKKRKADKTQNLKVTGAEKAEEKKMKGCEAEESKNTEQNSSSKSTTTSVTNNKNTKGTSANNTKENNNKTSEYPKPDYIHVRARRGQATDSHSLAERVRREKISERMKFLQDLVPGCNKITGKAGMLDEIINYVQSLQRQVEFLSMKLAVINPRLDFDENDYQVKEMYDPGCTSSDMVNHASLHQFNSLEQGVSNSSLEMLINPMDSTLKRTISAPVSIPQAFLDSSMLNQIQQLTWEDEIQNLYSMEYQQGQSASFISQPFTGLLETGHVKLEL